MNHWTNRVSSGTSAASVRSGWSAPPGSLRNTKTAVGCFGMVGSGWRSREDCNGARSPARSRSPNRPDLAHHRGHRPWLGELCLVIRENLSRFLVSAAFSGSLRGDLASPSDISLLTSWQTPVACPHRRSPRCSVVGTYSAACLARRSPDTWRCISTACGSAWRSPAVLVGGRCSWWCDASSPESNSIQSV